MSKKYAIIRFTRSITDDMDVIRSTPWAKDDKGFEKQFRSEFDGFLDMSRLVIEEYKLLSSDTYIFKTRLDLEGIRHTDPDTVLDYLVETIQRPYTEEDAGGHFDIETVTVDGITHNTVDLLNARSRPKM